MSVFKAYDIRGTWPDQLDEDLARRIGGAFVRLTGARSLAVGRDMRTMAPGMSAALIEGATRAGADVIDIGLASTPMTYYAIGSLGVDGGVQVTASHNPGHYIGFKFCRKGCVPVSGATGIADMEKMVVEGDGPPAATPGSITTRDVMSSYLDHVLAFGPDISKMKVVLDTANGMGGHALPAILERLPVDGRILFQELDGTFPNHEADPIKAENLEALSRAVIEDGADLGMAFDGDADRCVFVDSRGQPVRSDFVTAAMSVDFLEREPGAAVVYDLRSTRAVADAIKGAGGKPVRERVGHSFIKATMREHNAVFGGELSGHFYFRDNFVSDSGELAMVAMLSLLSRRGEELASLVAPYKRFASTGEVNFRVSDPDATMKALEDAYSDGETDHLDGITVRYSDWWFNLRKSNTEPLIRLNMEADDEDLLSAKRQELEARLGPLE